VCNKNVAVREYQDEIVFLHKIVEGGTDRSYGIHVARLAGVPGELLERARSILRDLEADNEDLVPRISSHAGRRESTNQLSLFGPPPSRVEAELKKLDPDRLSPLEALVELKRLRELL
jgi:DNA mismatch repair protein MutS